MMILRTIKTGVFSFGVQYRNLSQCKIAVVGAGPAGFYASQYLLKNIPESTIDIYEALPVPFGLVRYNV